MGQLPQSHTTPALHPTANVEQPPHSGLTADALSGVGSCLTQGLGFLDGIFMVGV